MTQLETTLTVLVWIYSTWCGYKLGQAAFRWWQARRRRARKDPYRSNTAPRRPKVWIELKGGGVHDGRQLYTEHPGPTLRIPDWVAHGAASPTRSQVFVFDGSVRRRILEPEEERIFRDEIAPMAGVSKEIQAELLALQHVVLIYRHVPEMK